MESFKLPLCCYQGASPLHSRRVDTVHKIYPFLEKLAFQVPGRSNKTFQDCPHLLFSHWLIALLCPTWNYVYNWILKYVCSSTQFSNHRKQLSCLLRKATLWLQGKCCPIQCTWLSERPLHHPSSASLPWWTKINCWFSPIPTTISCNGITYFKMQTPRPTRTPSKWLSLMKMTREKWGWFHTEHLKSVKDWKQRTVFHYFGINWAFLKNNSVLDKIFKIRWRHVFGSDRVKWYTMWSLISQRSFFEKPKQIQLNHPLYVPYFTPNDVYLLPKSRPVFKERRLAAFRIFQTVCHRGM